MGAISEEFANQEHGALWLMLSACGWVRDVPTVRVLRLIALEPEG